MQRVPPYLDFLEGVFKSLSGEVSTTDATPTKILEIVPEQYARGYLKVLINASTDDGTAGLIGEKIFHWKSVAGDVTLVSTVSVFSINRDGFTTADFTLDVGDDLLQVKVTGEAGKNINWSAFYLFDSITTTSLP